MHSNISFLISILISKLASKQERQRAAQQLAIDVISKIIGECSFDEKAPLTDQESEVARYSSVFVCTVDLD